MTDTTTDQPDEFTPLSGDELIDALHNERDGTNPRTDSASNAKYETLTWVLSLIEDPAVYAEEEAGEVDEAQAERDKRFEEIETGVPAEEEPTDEAPADEPATDDSPATPFTS